MSLKRGEQNIDITRQHLCALEELLPFQAFCRVDVDQDGVITAHDMIRFLRQCGHE